MRHWPLSLAGESTARDIVNYIELRDDMKPLPLDVGRCSRRFDFDARAGAIIKKPVRVI